MQMSALRNRAYFSQSPDIFARRLKIGEQVMFFGMDVQPTGTLGSPTNQEFLAYWNDLAADAGGTPDRKSFNPAATRRVLPFISLIEQADDDYRIRLTGTETDRVLGFVGRGRLISDLPPEFAQKWVPIYRRVLDNRQPFLYRNPAFGSDINRLEMEAVCVPFRHQTAGENGAGDDHAPTMIMTAFDICALD